MSGILTLATAGMHPDQLLDIEHSQYPRVDYVELRRFVDTDVVDYAAYERIRLGSCFRYLETKLRSDLYLAVLGLFMKLRKRRTIS